MTKNLMVRRDKRIRKEMERMGFGKVGSLWLEEHCSIDQNFTSSRINADQMRVYYKKTGNKQLMEAADKTFVFFALQEEFHKPDKTSWRATFKDTSDSVEFSMSWEVNREGTKDRKSLQEFCNMLERFGFVERANELNLEAVFSLGSSLEKAAKTITEIYKMFKEPIHIIEADLHARIVHIIRKENKKYAEEMTKPLKKQMKKNRPMDKWELPLSITDEQMMDEKDDFLIGKCRREEG